METSKLFVEFVGESAVDTGGPTRALFSIAFQQAEDSKITRGSLPNITFMHVKVHFQMVTSQHLANLWLSHF